MSFLRAASNLSVAYAHALCGKTLHDRELNFTDSTLHQFNPAIISLTLEIALLIEAWSFFSTAILTKQLFSLFCAIL